MIQKNSNIPISNSHVSIIVLIIVIVGYVLLRHAYSSYYTMTSVVLDILGGYLVCTGIIYIYRGTKFVTVFTAYDPLAMSCKWYARIYPFVLLFLGLLLHIHTGILLVTGIVILVFSLQTYTIIRFLHKKISRQCVCIGAMKNASVSSICVVHNIIIVLIALLGLLLSLF